MALDRGGGDWALLLGGVPVVAPAGGALDADLIRQLPNRAANITAVGPADPMMPAPTEGTKAVVRIFATEQSAPQTYDVVAVGKNIGCALRGALTQCSLPASNWPI
ncbi:MAG: hypothetical protein IPL79_07520 [Myxococcales bacterium]|nr:hypothetical protein [Myxococcales bacterium]